MTTGFELPEGNIAIVQDSYKYLWILQANGNHEEATSLSQIPMQSKVGVW